jgi:TP901 family phage tail tape measure protein
MSSRTVSVVLTAQVQNYLTNMKAAELRTLEVEKASRNATQAFAAHNQAVHSFGVGMLAAGGIAAAGLALAVKASTEFGAKMAQLQSLSHANAAEMKQLSNAALSVGTAYGFSATQVADAQLELVKAGIGIKAQLGGALVGALTLAAAGQLDVARATEITTVAMTQFQLSAKDVPHLADLLSAGADKALGSVGDLGEALKNGGLQAHNMGLTIDDTVGTLSAFANAGILGAEAGTQLRSMFLRLQNPTAASKKTMAEYGIAINDASGKFVGITKFAGELHDKLDGLSQAQRNQALATMFGSHAIIAASVLYQDGGKAADKAGTSIGDWIRNVNASGFAAAQAAGKMNSLQGDTQKLAASFQTDLIKGGTGANDVLRNLTQTATGALDVFGQIPAPVLAAGTSVLALVAGVGLIGGTALIAIPKVILFRKTMQDLGTTGRGLAGTIGKGGAVVLGLATIGEAFAAAAAHGTASTSQIVSAGAAMQNGWKGLDQTFSHVHNGIQDVHGLSAALDTLSNGEAAAAKAFDSVTSAGGFNPFPAHLADTYKSNEQSLDAMGQQFAGLAHSSLPAAIASFNGLVKQYHLTNTEQQTLLNAMPAYKAALTDMAGKAKVGASDQQLLNIAQGKGKDAAKVLALAQSDAAAAGSKQADTLASLSGQASAATTSIDGLQKTIEGFGSVQLDARSATRAMYQAIDDATAAVKKNGAGLSVLTQRGRDNQAALDGIATAADNAASKTLKQTGSVAQAQAVMKTGRDAYIKAAEAMGLGADAAKRLADKIGLIPKNITTAVGVTGYDAAAAKVAAIKAQMNQLDGSIANVEVAIQVAGGSSATAAQVGRQLQLLGREDGGPISGPGPKGKDSVLMVGAPGEHMWTAGEVDAVGGQGAMYRMRAAARSGQLQGFADGGAISEDQHAAAAASRALDRANRELAHAKREKDAAASKASHASEHAARIYGKGTAKAKHEASLEAAAAHREAAAAAKEETAAAAAAAKAKTARDAANARVAALQQNREDFVSVQTRATPGSQIDPLSYVDQLRSMSRDANYSSGRRKGFDAAATAAEAGLVKLQTSSAAAATKLTDLQNASTQMRDSIQQAVAGGYTLSGAATAAGSVTHTGGWTMQGGIRYQTSTTGGALTASSLAGYYQAGGGSALAFAAALKQLAGRGLNTQLLAELAGMGTEQGMPIAQAILSGSDADLGTINSGYGAIQSAAGLAGSTVADANYAAQIAAADANAKAITSEIATQGEALRKIIATAFGLKGYAVGTSSASPGLHWVGEHGPELVGFHGGERVLTAGDSRRWVRGSGGPSAAPQITVQAPAAKFPDTITVRDVHGFEMKMRVVASEEIARDAHHDAVLMMGGSTV